MIMSKREFETEGFPAISIIIPVYNGEKYIEHCVTRIEELNNDLLDDFEIIIVDDGSCDNSYSISRLLSDHYDNIVVVSKPNGGIASTRNLGLSLARGKYVVFCDQDDMHVKALYSFLKEIDNSQSDFMITNYCLSNGKKRELFSSNEICGADKVSSMARHMLAYGLVPYTEMPINPLCDVSTVWNCIFKRDFLVKHHIQFGAYVDYEDDWKFVTECLVKASKVYLNTDQFYCWTVNPNSESHTRKYISNYVEKREKLLSWIMKQLSKCGVSDDLIKHYRFSPEISRSVVMDNFYNACSLNYSGYKKDIDGMLKHNWKVNFSTIKKAKTKPQVLFLSLLYLKLFRTAFVINKFFLKRNYH